MDRTPGAAGPRTTLTEAPGDAGWTSTTPPRVDFEAFFRREHRRLFGALVLVTGDREEAFELLQDAFLSLWRRWDRTPPIEDPTAYLFRTAMNGFRMRRRRAAVAARRFLRPRDASDPLGAVDARDAVDRGLARATPRQRAALVLTALMGYPSEEAGRILGVRPATVRVLAKSARDTLRAALIEEEEGDG